MATKHRSSTPKGQIAVRIKGHNKCPSHRQNNVVILCQDCNTLICTICSITTHERHIYSFVEITNIANTQKKKLREFVNDTDDMKIPNLNKDLASAKNELSTYQPYYKTLSENIKSQRDQCRQDLDKITEDYISICDKMEIAATYFIQTHITNLEERLVTLVKLSSECKQTLQSGTAVLLYDTVSEIQETDLDTLQAPTIDTTDYTPGKYRESHMKQAMGKMKIPTDRHQAGSATGGHSNQGPVVKSKLSKSTETGQGTTRAVQYKLRDSPTVMSQFSYSDYITSICPTPDGGAWLCACTTNIINLINNKGHVIQRIQHSSRIKDISLDPTTGRLLFCCMSERTIHELSASSTPVTRFTTKLYPRSLCVTRDGQVVVGTWNKVVVYTADGRVLHSDSMEGSLGGSVSSITHCDVTGNIALVTDNRISEDRSVRDYISHIIVYHPTLQTLIHYRGEGIPTREAVTPDKFDPRTVVYDSKGNSVIADNTRNTIELISGAGEYIKTLHTNTRRQGPVGIQKDDVLWSDLLRDTEERVFKLLKYYSD